MNDIITRRDNFYWDEMANLINDNDIDLKFISENICSFVMRRHTNQIIAYYDIFQRIINTPGSILEFGVFYGNGLFTWLNLLETFVSSDRGRKVYGFDDFKGYERSHANIDSKGIQYIDKVRGSFKISPDTIYKIVDLHNSDNLVPYDRRCILYDGDVRKTLPQFSKDNPGVRICLANLDLNLYEPTKFVLECVWDLLVKGGIVVFRGYGSMPWEGESKAIDEFFLNKKCKFETISFNNTPGCFVQKL